MTYDLECSLETFQSIAKISLTGSLLSLSSRVSETRSRIRQIPTSKQRKTPFLTVLKWDLCHRISPTPLKVLCLISAGPYISLSCTLYALLYGCSARTAAQLSTGRMTYPTSSTYAKPRESIVGESIPLGHSVRAV
ncbi:hypothetical protein BJX65DRAFT_271996 [Aspergillus insuetus]